MRECPTCEHSTDILTGEVQHVQVSKSLFPRVSVCRELTIKGRVELTAKGQAADGSKKIAVGGLRRCGSAWRCPECAKAQMIKDATALHAVNLGWREMNKANKPKEVLMITLTVPHSSKDKTKALRQSVTKAFTRCHNGKPWLKARQRFGIKQGVRRLEVTYGKNGPHPHIHALLFIDGRLTDQQKNSLRAWYVERWSTMAKRHGMGQPNHEAIHLSTADKDGAYIAKMGLLELSGDFQKVGRCLCCKKHMPTEWDEKKGRRVCVSCGTETNRTPWQILADHHAHREPRDRRLWLEYYEQIKGARRLTWTRFADGLNLREMFLGEEKQRALEFSDEAEVLCVHESQWGKLDANKKQDLIDALATGDKWGIMAALGPDFRMTQVRHVRLLPQTRDKELARQAAIEKENAAYELWMAGKFTGKKASHKKEWFFTPSSISATP